MRQLADTISNDLYLGTQQKTEIANMALSNAAQPGYQHFHLSISAMPLVLCMLGLTKDVSPSARARRSLTNFRCAFATATGSLPTAVSRTIGPVYGALLMA